MKVFVKTYGCTFNQRDSETIKGVLQHDDFTMVDSERKADVIVVNSCGVKGVTQDKIISYIKAQKKKVYVGGCLTKMIDMAKYSNVAGVFDPNTISQVGHQIKNNTPKNFSNKKEDKLGILMVNAGEEKTIIPISEGCLGDCTFCSVKLARGRLHSYRVGDIVRAMHGKKIYLTSQDCGCYGFDIGTNLAELLREVVDVDGDFIIRVGMMSPEHVLVQLPELIAAFKHSKIMKFLHLPLQSGSNKVLRDMRRKYTIAEYKYIVKEFRKAIPEIHIATDIIVGYPTENEEDFIETKKLMEDMQFEVVNLSKFTARPRTYAEKLKQLPGDEIKRRSEHISVLIREQTKSRAPIIIEE